MKFIKFQLTFIFILLNSLSCSLYAKEFDYVSYIKNFNELEKISEENFSNLRFTYSEKQIKISASYKVVLKDQFERDWLFKAGAHSSKDGAIAIYRLFLLTGIETPEIHYSSFIINGEKVEGALQRVYPVRPTPLPLTALNNKSHMYMAKNHAMAWLALNNHTHQKQFIYLATPENNLNILRIDNSVNWFLLNNDQLNTSYFSPMLFHTTNAGYFAFWNDFLAYDIYKTALENKTAPLYDKQDMYLQLLQNKKFDLNLNQLYAWILFIQKIPDSVYGSFFNQIEKNDFIFSSNGSVTSPWFITSEYMPGFDKKSFIKNIIARKNNAPLDFKKFYEYISSLKQQKLNSGAIEQQNVESEMIEFLDTKLTKAKELKTKMSQGSLSPQQNITAEISLSSQEIISKILLLAQASTIKERMYILNEIKSGLSEQLIKKKNTPEEVLLQNAQENIRKIKIFLEKPKPQGLIFKMILDYHPLFEKNAFKALDGIK